MAATTHHKEIAMSTTIKTSAARIQVGDVIDFDQHKGAFQRYDDRSSLPGKEDQASGLVTVVAVKRVVTSHPNAYKKTTAIAITFEYFFLRSLM